MIPEKESMEYALLQNLSFHNAECPYSVHALRGEFRDIINNLEYLHPGTRHSIVQSYEDIKDLLLERYPPAKLKKCTRCGEPTSQQMCKTCVLLKKIKTA